jgi:predicted deacetylase
MSSWLDPVRRALAERYTPLTFFFRDDDAGWDDDGLFRLLDVFVQAPIALAAIPMAVSPRLAARLRPLLSVETALVSVHQHGLAHANHEPTGRRSEFGPSRARHLQRRDLAIGRDRLQQALGLALPPIFTPPWNRCTRDTVDCLAELGFEVLSRDAAAEPRALGSLRELPVCLDWTGRRGARLGADRWGERIASAIAPGRTVGVMLHHAAMTADDRRMLGDLLDVLAASPDVGLLSMLDSKAASTTTGDISSCAS